MSTTLTPSARSLRIRSQVRAPRLRIHAGGRLVEEDQLRTADQRQGQRQPLLLPAGQPLDRGRVRRRSARPGRAARRSRAGARRRRRTARSSSTARAPRCSRRRRPAASRRPAVAARRASRSGSRPSTRTAPASGRAEALADLDGRRLAGAVRAEQREHLAALDGQRQPVDRARARRSDLTRSRTSTAASRTLRV